MRTYIETPKGRIYYTPKTIFLGIKKINRDVAKENLLVLHKVAAQTGFEFSLAYGTLLGAVREHNFIEHDEDIDLFVKEEKRGAFLSFLFNIQDYGFELIRVERHESVYSISRKGEYIDFYIAKIEVPGIRQDTEKEKTPDKYLSDLVKYSFLGEQFLIPRDYEECLIFLYGENWKIPLQYANFEMPWVKKSAVRCVWFVMNEILPLWLYKKILYVKTQKKGIELYNRGVARVLKKFHLAQGLIYFPGTKSR